MQGELAFFYAPQGSAIELQAAKFFEVTQRIFDEYLGARLVGKEYVSSE
jgi:hypothetical protein